MSDALTRQHVQDALHTLAWLIKEQVDDQTSWNAAWETVTAGIWADIAVTISVPEAGLLIRVLPEVPETGPDRVEAIAITFDKTDSRRHQLLRLAHEWRTQT